MYLTYYALVKIQAALRSAWESIPSLIAEVL
jgi:hypothetical protein